MILAVLLIVCFYATDRIVAMILSSAEEKIFTGHRVGKVNYFFNVKDSMDILIFGSSRAVHHVDPKTFDRPTFNMGMGATHLGYAAALIATLGKKKQIVMVQIDYKTMFSPTYSGKDAIELLYKASKNNAINHFFDVNFPEEKRLSKLSRSYVYNGRVFGVIKNYMLHAEEVRINNGYEPLIPDERQKQIFKGMLAQTETKTLEIFEPIKINERYKQFIYDIKEVAAKNNNLLVFFTSPSLVKIDNRLIEMTTNFLEKEGLEYLNHTEIVNGEDPELWKDHTHLSKKGATIYSKKLASSLNVIIDKTNKEVN